MWSVLPELALLKLVGGRYTLLKGQPKGCTRSDVRVDGDNRKDGRVGRRTRGWW